jgi:hypothetical protein
MSGFLLCSASAHLEKGFNLCLLLKFKLLYSRHLKLFAQRVVVISLFVTAVI